MKKIMILIILPYLVIKIHEERPGIKIEGNKIILEKEKERIILRPKDIEKWKEHLSRFLY